MKHTYKNIRFWIRPQVLAPLVISIGMAGLGVWFLLPGFAATSYCGSVSDSGKMNFKVCISSSNNNLSNTMTAQALVAGVTPTGNLMTVQKCSSTAESTCTNVFYDGSTWAKTSSNTWSIHSPDTAPLGSNPYYRACSYIDDSSGYKGGGCSPIVTNASLKTATPPPSPTPAPAPAPKPAPAPAPKPAPAPAPKTTIKSPSATSRPKQTIIVPTQSSTPAAPTITRDGSVTITAGTVSVSLKIPVNNAAKVHLNYGTDAYVLDLSTKDQPVSGSDLTVTLTGLHPSTQYTYNIVRTGADGKAVTSPDASFSTLGFDYTLTFTSHNKGVAGLAATLKQIKKSGTSDSKGNILFHDVPPGTYTVAFTYHGQATSKTITIDPSIIDTDVADGPAVATAKATINLDAISQPVSSKSSSHTGATIVAILLVLLALLCLGGFGVWLFLRRSSNQSYSPIDYTINDTGPLPPPSVPVPAAPTVPPPLYPYAPAPPAAQADGMHTGESLRDLVVKDMARKSMEQQQQNGQNNDQFPHP
jgi:hypothetical protein